jgi:DNA polymerase III alpha subunit
VRKKKEDVLAGLKQEFISSAAERGVARATIDKLFEAFEPFAN